MKRIHIYILTLLSLFFCHKVSAQWCNGVTVEVYGPNPQTGGTNYWGVRATIPAPYMQNITIYGFIGSANNGGGGWPFTIYLNSGLTEESTGIIFETSQFDYAVLTGVTIDPCPEVWASYAGVYVAYETFNNVLRFNSASDFNTLLDALDAANETWEENYESQYANLTPEQLDDMDDANGYDEFKEYRQFEQLFQGFYSKRKQIEDVENNWLNSDLTATNPDAVDFSADDALNAVSNAGGMFKIGPDLYELRADGLYINGALQLASNGLRRKTNEELAAAGAAKQAFMAPELIGLAGPSWGPKGDGDDDDAWIHPFCKSNKKVVEERVIGNELYKLKVALNSVYVRSTIKTKVVHYKKKSNGKFKRARAKLAVYCAAKIYENNCVWQFDMSERHPSGGWKNRKQLKLTERDYRIIWRTKSNECSGSFEQDNGNNYSVLLTF